MRRVALITALLFCNCFCFSQKISNVDFDAIKKKLEATPDLYNQLLNRFVQADTTLTKNDYHLIYYGQCFQPSYNPNASADENSTKFQEYFIAEDYGKALPYALKIMEKNPLDMKTTLRALLCYYGLRDDASRLKLLPRYNNIMLTIHRSGDGLSEATAFVTMCMSDNDELLTTMKIEASSKKAKGECIVMTLKENKNHVKEVYFNISKPYQSMLKGN